MPFYEMSLETFEDILKKPSLDLTPKALILLSTDVDEIKRQLVRLKKAIEGTTRYISDVKFVMVDGTNLNEIKDSSVIDMYATHLKDPMTIKYNLQIDLKKRIEEVPYGPYFDFFRTPSAPHNVAGRRYSESEIVGLNVVPESFFSGKKTLLVSLENNTISGYTA
jgi:hypothetical protein